MKTIKNMPEHSRPREKLREKGASALTDEELELGYQDGISKSEENVSQ